MKLSAATILAALAVFASSAAAAEAEKRCTGMPMPQQPVPQMIPQVPQQVPVVPQPQMVPAVPQETPEPDPEQVPQPKHKHHKVPSAACESNTIAALIGVGLLNCPKINVLSNIHQRRGLDFSNHRDPIVEDMLKRAKVKPMCEDAAFHSLEKDGLLDCKSNQFNAQPEYHANDEVCGTKTAALLASIHALQCSNIKVVETKKRSTDSPHEEFWVNVLRRQIATRQCERANEELGVRMIDCSHPDIVLSRLAPGLGQQQQTEEGGEQEEEEASKPECQSNTLAGLIAVGALNCPKINVLSNVPEEDSRRRALPLINVQALENADINVLSNIQKPPQEEEQQEEERAIIQGRRDHAVRKRIAEAIQKGL